MGFCDWICDVASSAWEGIKDVASSAWEGIKTVTRGVATLGKPIIAVAKPLAYALSCVVPQIGVPLLTGVKWAEKAVQVASVASGIFGEDESLEVFGAKALEAQEQGISIENYENVMEGIEKIQETPVDLEQNKYTPDERTFAGAAVLAYALKKEFDIPPEIYALFVRYNKFFSDERIARLVKYAEKMDFPLGDLGALFSTNATMLEKDRAKNFLFEAEKFDNRNFNEEKFDEELREARETGPINADASQAL